MSKPRRGFSLFSISDNSTTALDSSVIPNPSALRKGVSKKLSESSSQFSVLSSQPRLVISNGGSTIITIRSALPLKSFFPTRRFKNDRDIVAAIEPAAEKSATTTENWLLKFQGDKLR